MYVYTHMYYDHIHSFRQLSKHLVLRNFSNQSLQLLPDLYTLLEVRVLEDANRLSCN